MSEDRHERLAHVIKRARKVQRLADTLLADDLPDAARTSISAARTNAILADMFLTDDRAPMSDARFERGLGMVQLAESIAKTTSLQIAAPHAARGHKVVRSASRGHEAVNGTDHEKAARWAAYQSALEEKMQRNPALSLTEARRQVARETGMSFTTIKRHTTDPR